MLDIEDEDLSTYIYYNGVASMVADVVLFRPPLSAYVLEQVRWWGESKIITSSEILQVTNI